MPLASSPHGKQTHKGSLSLVTDANANPTHVGRQSFYLLLGFDRPGTFHQDRHYVPLRGALAGSFDVSDQAL